MSMTLTVGELIEKLKTLDPHQKVQASVIGWVDYKGELLKLCYNNDGTLKMHIQVNADGKPGTMVSLIS